MQHSLPGGTHRWSLRRRLLVLMLSMTVGLWILSAVLFYFEAQAEGRKLFDRSLSESGSLLLRLAEHEIAEHGPAMAAELLQAETHVSPMEIRFQIWTEDLRLRHSRNELRERPFLPMEADGFGWTRVNGQSWRAYATWNPQHTLQLQIAEPLTRRKELSSWTYVHLTLLAGLLLPVSMALIGWILNRSIAPLRRSATAVGERSPDDLRPVGPDDAPEEVAPLLGALDRLLGKVREVLQRERRFTADASHELRSPLAAIRVNAQILCDARDSREREEISKHLLASVDRASRLIDQLLLLARIDSGSYAQRPRSTVSLDALVTAECSAHQAAAERRGVTLSVSTAPATVLGEADLLTILIRNLIDNSIRYCEPGCRIQVRCSQDAAEAVVIVEDDGPGIAAEDRERIFERFYRVVGHESPGSGLGLSIVQMIAQIHGGCVTVAEGLDGKGSSFRVSLPTPPGQSVRTSAS